MISYGPLQSSAVKERSYTDRLTKGLAIEGTEASALEKELQLLTHLTVVWPLETAICAYMFTSSTVHDKYSPPIYLRMPPHTQLIPMGARNHTKDD